jgi:hypothetical protein
LLYNKVGTLQIEKPPATAENYPKKKEATDSNIVVGLMVFFGEPLYITWIVKNLHSHTINFNQAWRNTNWLSKGMKKEKSKRNVLEVTLFYIFIMKIKS